MADGHNKLEISHLFFRTSSSFQGASVLNNRTLLAHFLSKWSFTEPRFCLTQWRTRSNTWKSHIGWSSSVRKQRALEVLGDHDNVGVKQRNQLGENLITSSELGKELWDHLSKYSQICAVTFNYYQFFARVLHIYITDTEKWVSQRWRAISQI